jgi:NAD+ synthase/NAD+ synthase (glutamine-hydrolysing)
MKVALLQINPTVGDLTGNARLILDALAKAQAAGAALAVTPELALVGYLPRDLLLSEGFVKKSWDVGGSAGARCRATAAAAGRTAGGEYI